MKSLGTGWGGILVLCLIGMTGALTSTGILFLPQDAQLVPILDHTNILIDARTMLNHASLFLNHDLGFPVGADHYYFPRPDYWELFTLWIGTVLTNDAFESVYFYYVVSISLIFLSCFFSLLWLRLDRFSAFIMAIAYCLLPFAVDRFSGQDYLAAYYAAPMGAALALHLGRLAPAASIRKTVLQNTVTPFPIIAVLVIAWSGVYYAFFSVFFIALAGFFLATGRRKIEPLAVAATQIAAIIILLGIGLAPYLLRPETFPVRGPDDQYAAAIRIPDFVNLFSDLSHRLAKKYIAYTNTIRPHSEGADFWPGPILSWIALLSPVLVMMAAVRQKDKPLLHPAHERTILLAVLLITAAILFGLPESYGYLFNMLVTGTIRAQNRASVFVAFFALVVLQVFLSELQTHMPKRRYAAPVILVALLLMNAWPTLGYAWKANAAAAEDGVLQANRASIKATLKALQKVHAQNVLQLPIAGWPEIPDIGKFSPYDHLWFYIYDVPQSPRRWSYGLDWHQPEFAGLRRLGTALETTPGQPTWMPFRCLGFDAVEIEKSAYAPTTVTQIEKSLARLGIRHPLFENENRAAFTLASLSYDATTCPHSY